MDGERERQREERKEGKKEEKEGRRGKERKEISTSSLPKWPQQRRLSQTEVRNVKFIQVSHVGTGSHILETSPAAFPGAVEGN